MKFDLIWVGSLFTHTSRTRTFSWLSHLCKHLSANGVAVATFHGRYSSLKGREYGYMDESSWREVQAEYDRTGYGYRDYQVHGHGFIEGAYGVSLTNPSLLMEEVQRIKDVRTLNFAERGWAGHQDVLVFGKPGFEIG